MRATFPSAWMNYIGWRNPKAFTIPVHWNEKEGLFEATLPRERVGQHSDKQPKKVN